MWVAETTSAKRLALFHHDPSHDDTFMDGIALAVDKARAGSIIAREGLSLKI